MSDVMDGGGEVYTVGVRLALEDGVSAGIAALEADLALFGQALAASPGLGAAASALTVAQAGAVRARVVPDAGDAAPAVGGTVAREVVRERVVRMPGPVERIVVPGVVAPVETAAGARVVPDRTPVVAPVREGGREKPEAASDVGREPARMLAPVVLPLERSAGTGGDRAGWDARRAGGAAAAGGSGGALAPSSPEPLLEGAPAGPVAPGSPWAWPVAAALPQVAPVASGGGEGSSVGGAVYLDGRLLGQWMSEQLAEAAGRPMGGAVGFDGRMGPAWPGALQGG